MPFPGISMDSMKNDELRLGIVEHMAGLRCYARFLMRSADQTDDLVQDCIARALSRAHLYRQDSNLRAWLFTILRNIFITQSRKATHRRNYAAECLAMSSGITQPNQLHTVELRERLHLMRALPARERQAVALLGIFDMTYEEAARHTGAKIGTMKSRTSRGRANLRLLSLAQNRSAESARA